ncbi:Gldg family protein [Cyanobacterium stanieri LEGE 03274]|uniref:Gldg family protein n=1 Tax=Cyanobacterium stanieri LEGE 03274 TaxID=1828756 RepID=A0ABR9UZW7_9CHRO|nr:Gldg family protein [Cyanobacterium stanieri]MBE9221185.1 Gldg family protein [Cyanobacterium stanieri LEGE 03274]
MKNYKLYLSFIGIFLLSAGVIVSFLSETASLVGFIVLGLGVLVLGFVVISYLYQNKGFWAMRSTEATTNALVSTGSVILILGVINYLGINYSWRVDLTENQIFTLSPESRELVSNLDEPLRVYVFDSPANPNDRTLLEDYQRNNNLFEYEFVDPQIRFSLAQEFGVQRKGDVYIEKGNQRQLVQTVSPNSRLTETALTNAIATIQRTEQPIVYILQGHGEPTLEEGENSFSQAITNLTDRGYVVQGLNLTTTPLVPPNADVLIMGSGTRELLEGEVRAIEKFVNNGGSLLVMYDAQSPVSLNPLFVEWGIVLHDGLIVDGSGTGDVFGLGPSVTFVVDYGNHPITSNFDNGISIFPFARAILTTQEENITPNPLLLTNPQTWAENDLTQDTIEFNPQEDLPGPLNVGVALVRENPDAQTESNTQTPENTPPATSESENETSQEEDLSQGDLPQPPPINEPNPVPIQENNIPELPPETRMVVIGNSTFATNGWFSQQLNSDIWLNSIAWLSGADESELSISPKLPNNRRLNIENIHVTLISWLALFIIPALGFGASILIWWRRSK